MFQHYALHIVFPHYILFLYKIHKTIYYYTKYTKLQYFYTIVPHITRFVHHVLHWWAKHMATHKGIILIHISFGLCRSRSGTCTSERSVLVVDISNVGEVDRHKDLSVFDKSQIVVARRLSQSILETARFGWCPQSAVVNMYRQLSEERHTKNQWQGFRSPRFGDLWGQRRSSCLGQIDKSATVAEDWLHKVCVLPLSTVRSP